MAYYGKYNLSKKAVDIDLLKIEPIAFDVTQQHSEMNLFSPPTPNLLNFTPTPSSTLGQPLTLEQAYLTQLQN